MTMSLLLFELDEIQKLSFEDLAMTNLMQKPHYSLPLVKILRVQIKS
jgi:hypothetical protein